jgi:hypothetical protein
VLPDATRKTLGHFDTDGRLVRWPTKYAVQQRALWALWARLPARRVLTEREVNHARLLWRTPDCSTYRKEPRRPEGEVREFLTVLFEHTRE